MNKLKQAFAELRQNTPAHVQWMLLFAAFLVVVILLLLLLSGPGKQTPGARTETTATLMLDPAEIEWRNVTVGEERTRIITVKPATDTVVSEILIVPNTAARAAGIETARAVGLSHRSACTTMGPISQTVPCTVTLTWQPMAALENTGFEIQIMYHAANQRAEMGVMAALPVLLSARTPDVAPAPVLPTLPLPTDTFMDEPEPLLPIVQFPEDDWLFESEPSPFTPPPVFAIPTPIMPPAPPIMPAASNCLDFAFPGYNLQGRQFGWIRPVGGRFLFHPFGDNDCINPIGEYDMHTGLIYDLNNPARSIGSDADRIGGRTFGARDMPLPQLSSPRPQRTVNRASQMDIAPNQLRPAAGPSRMGGGGNARIFGGLRPAPPPTRTNVPTSLSGNAPPGSATVSSQPTDRTFVLRQFKPIPATIVNEVRADARTLNMGRLPVTATVDRHVYSDNGRTIIIPAGTQMLGHATGDMPGPYRTIGRMQIEWYRFVRPDGVEFNFTNHLRQPFSADSQGRVGVPGRGSTDYIENMIMPMMTALVPAAVNLIAPISDRFVNQIDLDNNTVTQSGVVRSSELAKQEIISTWNNVVQRLVLDMMDNTTPPFSIAAGTRITVFSPSDLVITCGPEGNPSCNVAPFSDEYADPTAPTMMPSGNQAEWIGQVRSMNASMDALCAVDGNQNFTGQPKTDNATMTQMRTIGVDFRTVVYYCQSRRFQPMNQVRWDQFVQHQAANNPAPGTQAWQQQMLGMQFTDGQMHNPFAPPPPAQQVPQQPPQPQVPFISGTPMVPAAPIGLTCEDGTPPDGQGCCTGEVLTNMDEMGWNCCPAAGGDCFPPLR
jgi:type IV secretory pathway VirB10-like protein